MVSGHSGIITGVVRLRHGEYDGTDESVADRISSLTLRKRKRYSVTSGLIRVRSDWIASYFVQNHAHFINLK